MNYHASATCPHELSNYLTLTNRPLSFIFALHSKKKIFIYLKYPQPRNQKKKPAVVDSDVLCCGGFHGKVMLCLVWEMGYYRTQKHPDFIFNL
jgi:hypothetical protein